MQEEKDERTKKNYHAYMSDETHAKVMRMIQKYRNIHHARVRAGDVIAAIMEAATDNPPDEFMRALRKKLYE